MESKMTVKISSLTEEGIGICYVENNLIEIEGVVPGDEVEIIIIKKLKNKYLARVNKIIKESEDRDNKCHLSGICGGCDFINYVYDKQLEYKEDKIRKIFSEYISKIEPIVSGYPYNYRNKTIYTLHLNKIKNVIGGYYKKRSHDVINVKGCPLDNNEVSEVFESIKDIINELKITIFNPTDNTGSLRYLFARVNDKGHIMLGLVSAKRSFPKKKELVDLIIKRNKNVKTIVLNFNDSVNNAILGEENEILYKEGFIIDKLKNKKIKISLSSFYQVNKEMIEKLYDIVINESDLKKEDTVLDAYCGTGTIGLLLANYVKSVIGVEINPNAIEDANYNKAINHQDNILFVAEDASKFILEEVNNKVSYSLVVMDPPRSGSSKVFLDSLIKLEPRRITYISCNPLTLKRDLDVLKEKYEINKIIPVDMFPSTKHIEVVCVLKLKK